MARKIELEVEVGGIGKINSEIDKLQSSLSEMKTELKGFKEGSAEFNKLSQSIKDTEKEINNLGGSVEEASNSAGSLRQQLREMILELQGLEPGTDRFNELTRAAGELRDQIADTNAVINAASGAPLENLGKGLGNATKIGLNGFQGIQGAMAVFGNESQNLQKTMVQLQGIMAMTQAIESFGQLGDQITNMKASFGSFFISAKAGLQGIKAGVAATGIGLLVIAVGLLVAYWDEIVSLLGFANSEQEKNVELAKENVKVAEGQLEQFQNQENSLRLQGKSEKEILQLRMEKINLVIAEQEAFVAAMKQKSELEIKAAQQNQEITKGAIRGILELNTAVIRAISAPLDLMLEAVNQVSDFLGFGEITSFRVNKAITEMNEYVAEAAANWFFDVDEVRKKNDELIAEEERKLEKMRSDRDGIQLQIIRMEKEAAQAGIENAKQREEKLRELREKELETIKAMSAAETDILRQKRDTDIDLMEEGFSKQRAIIERAYQKDRQAIIDASIKDEIAALDLRFVEGTIKEEEYLAEVAKLRLDGAGKLSDDELALLKAKGDIRTKALLQVDINENNKRLQAQKDYQALKDSLITDADAKAKAAAEKTFNDQKAKLDQFLKDGIISEEQYSLDIQEITEQRNNAVDKINTDARNKELLKTKSFFDQLTGVFNSLRDGATGMFAGIGASITGAMSSIMETSTKTFDTFNFQLGNTAEKVNAYAQAIGGMIQGILGAVSQEQQERLEENLERVEETYNAETAALEQQRNQGLITEQQFAQRKYEVDLKRFNQEEKLRKDAFENEKSMKIASTITSGLMGAVSAFAGAMQLGPIAGPIVGALLAAAVGAMTAVNVAQITATKYKGGTPPMAPGGGVPDVGSVVQGAMEAPTPDQFMGQFAEGANQGGQEQSAGERQVIRAYVLETDITNVQNTISTYEQRAEIG